MTREFAPELPPEPDLPLDHPGPTAAARRRAGALRNKCVIAALAVYAAVNALGLGILRSPQPFAYRYADAILGVITLGGLAMIALYIASCCLSARARGWSAWLGAAVALVALGGTYAAAYLILFQNANHATSLDNPARVYDNRTPALFPIAFVLSALVLRALPMRRGTRAVVARDSAAR